MYGQKLLQQRKLKGWTQKHVSEKLGVTKQTYSHYENEKRTPNLPTILKLGEIFNVNIHELFSESSPASETQVSIPIEESSASYIDTIISAFINVDGELSLKIKEKKESIPKDWIEKGKFFYFQATDNSMKEIRIMKGDTLLIRKQKKLNNGDVALIFFEDNLLIRKITKTDDLLLIESANSTLPTKVIPLQDNNLLIIGKLERIIITKI